MTQDARTQANSGKLASRSHATSRTLAQRRSDLERQIRSVIESDPRMALTDPAQVSERMKLLRDRVGMKQYEVAQAINEPPRTFQSWENAEVETDRANYEKVAKFYSRKLREKISANWILFGQETAPAIAAPSSLNGSLPAGMQEQLDRIEQRLQAIEDRLSTAEKELPEVVRAARQTLAQGRRRAPQARPAKKQTGR